MYLLIHPLNSTTVTATTPVIPTCAGQARPSAARHERAAGGGGPATRRSRARADWLEVDGGAERVESAGAAGSNEVKKKWNRSAVRRVRYGERKREHTREVRKRVKKVRREVKKG